MRGYEDVQGGRQVIGCPTAQLALLLRVLRVGGGRTHITVPFQ